jgi:serine/threonine-protein kinase
MDPERYQKAGDLYHQALDLPADLRSAFLEEACGSDVDLRADVESLLAAHEQAGQFIESPDEQANVLLQSMLDSAAEAAAGQDLRSSERKSSAAGLSAAVSDSDASLTPGQRLGRYEVLDLLGAGGMGSVYRALDPSLGREVAIKALGRTFRGDSASLKRFEREARVLATLSHPNIATIYGFEHLDGSPYLVLERVDGQTLASRLQRGAIPVDDAIGIATQIVAGLEEAHAQGVVHRDLKPSNVMLTPDGRVKLVDFGLAKTTRASAGLDVSADPITAPGVVLGTARYMSPEQVKGEDVDTRCDVWAFGCVLYEMLTGRPAFAGRSVSEVVAAVLRDDPDWDALPPAVPRNVVRLLRRCLRRDSRFRLQHVGDARLDLTEQEEPATATMGTVRSSVERRALIAIAIAVIATLGAFVAWRSPRAVPPNRPARLSLELPARLALANEPAAPFAIAPAGSHIVFEAVEGGIQQLYVRELTDPAMRLLPGTEGARQPFFSTDGAWIGFFANRKLSKVPLAGGPVLQVADIGNNPRGMVWAPDGTIVFAAPQTAGLSRVSGNGGKPTPLTTLDKARGEASHRWPDLLPGGKWVLFTVGLEEAAYDEARIDVVSLETGERREVMPNATFGRYSPDGRLLFVRGGHLHAVGFDVDRLVVQGTPEVVLDPVRYDPRNGGGYVAVSASGSLLYGPGEPTASEFYLSWVDREGRLSRVSDPPRPFRSIKTNPDGRRIAAVIGTSAESDLWVVDANGTLSRLSFGLSPHRPTWTSSGSGITVAAQKDGTWRLLTWAADGKGEPTVLLESPHRVYPNAWSRDGRHLIFQESRPETGWDLKVLEVDAAGRPVGAPRDFASTPFHETGAAISPDGRWVAYESDEIDGLIQIYVRSFPDAAHKTRMSPSGGRLPAWDSRGNLHYLETPDYTMWAVHTAEKNAQLIVDTPQAVWQGPGAAALLRRIANPLLGGTSYDVDPSGTRFLVLETPATSAVPELSQPMIVLDWAHPRRD